MSASQIEALKQEMERIEADSKLRKRKPKGTGEGKGNGTHKGVTKPACWSKENKIVFNPLMVPAQQAQAPMQHHKKIEEITDLPNLAPQGQSPGLLSLSSSFSFLADALNAQSAAGGQITALGTSSHQSATVATNPLSLNVEDDSFIDLFSPHLLQNHFKYESPPALPDEETTRSVTLTRRQPRTSQSPPTLYTNPSYVKTSTLNYLTPIGKHLYEYYRDHLSFVVNSAKKDENMYLNTFLPMAHVDLGVLYGILAWSSFHMGGERLERQGKYYINQAHREFIRSPLLLGDETSNGLGYVDCHPQFGDASSLDEDVEKEMKLDSMKKENLSRDNMINMRLAAFEILCGVEICKGDVSNWSKYLRLGSKLIKMKGGLESFNSSKDDHFLATNYAYHDITSVSVNNGNLHFDLRDYEKMWIKSSELGFTDPLHNLSSPIFKIIAEINTLVNGSRKLTSSLSPASDTSSPSVGVTLEELNRLQSEKLIDTQGSGNVSAEGAASGASARATSHTTVGSDQNASPGASDVDGESEEDVNLDDLNHLVMEYQRIDQLLNTVRPRVLETEATYSPELELQLTIFECFQITAKIHLRQSVMRMNSSCMEIQYLINQLVNLLDVILGSDFESCLCFPMFIAGLNCVRKRDRADMLRRFKEFIDRYKWKNLVRCEVVIRKVWERNEKGRKFVDWYSIVNKLGWDLSFA